MTEPTDAAGARRATHANTPPVPTPRQTARVMKVAADHTSGGGCNAAANASSAVPASEASTTCLGAIRSESHPPTGRASTAARANPAVRAPASTVENP
ncbi:Uncharacterised protein [Mycobacterium tuberculosis]|uniref:Uncharacterized protein n=1 Tax=Mycobacterium tuberculosis TaxID=1773 RepID=A0A655A0T2_MYCTX|nr:Uncharacterised protein [Mycobacterium tuberculosis]CFV44592.1 Uncharacterised protein [Mycobacterium tuberculosis]CKR40916.1 Uncharacterised protein [Mycobacterium tuberculosis]CKR55073.1 Uncharacterised protein [Mycobacterium tuberculosis]CKR71581.1 Uncharacterised protein [Mycobacterium tuberculosis]